MGSSLSTPISQNDLNASTSSFSRLPSLASYFRSPPQEQFVHTHPEDAGRRLKAVADIEIENLLATKLPRELVHRILDDAEVWGECRVENRRALSVASSGLSPRGRRGFEWGMEQDDELSREMEQGEHEGGGLVDAPGKVWYLVSPPIGCAAEKVKKKEPSVGGEYDYEYAPTAHRNMTRGARQDPGQQLEQQDGPHSSLHDPSEHASGYSSGPSKRGRHWLRSVTVETFSRDQGWSDNQAAYGTYNQSYSWMELSLLRDGQEVPESRCTIQYNVVAGQYHKAHTVFLDTGHPLVRNARDGDRIVLWVRAMYPGWVNHIRHASLTLKSAPWAPTFSNKPRKIEGGEQE
ncbi:uncharacterized protein EHS24_002726 [Apiotrichum porosum]|uniref:Uncharacterized protein n=1 Tax=Apiotrichum porosum TaxID=105984 RepID=A0A427XHA2_9TREE|nr:uncharacterized protein EHS24_002726 [Apiotrichum porosum]RSH78261.1 hypothetical protein EHS24_002726 [Apiotrichum porosum]